MNLASEYTGQILTPALLIDVEAVERNLEITLQRLSGDAERWPSPCKNSKVGRDHHRPLASSKEHAIARQALFTCLAA